MPINQQATLLSALQSRQITPVGGSKSIKVNIRLICATNENLIQAVQEGRFRQDLLYRINTVEIRLPPLRDRVDDILLLAEYYLEHFNHKYKRTVSIAPEDVQVLCQYSWPGNVRELAHVIERSVILSDTNIVDIRSVINANTAPTLIQLPTDTDSNNDDTFNLEVVEQRTVRAALKHHQGNVTKAAKALGLTRGAMYRRLEKYDL